MKNRYMSMHWTKVIFKNKGEKNREQRASELQVLGKTNSDSLFQLHTLSLFLKMSKHGEPTLIFQVSTQLEFATASLEQIKQLWHEMLWNYKITKSTSICSVEYFILFD